MNSSHQNKSFSPIEAVNVIEQVAGIHKGYRRAHAKGIGFDALFTPNDNAAPFTQASFLQGDTQKVIVRFSHSSPIPDTPDQLIPIKGMAVQFPSPNDKPISLVMANVPVFPTKTPAAFVRLIQAFGGKDISLKAKLATLSKDTEFKTIPPLLKRLKTPASFATTRFWALHAYILDTTSGERQAVRFSFEPVAKEDQLPFTTKDMELELLERMVDSPVHFRLLMTLAASEDPINDPSISWPDDRLVVDVGDLVLTEKRADLADNHLFNPTNEAPGFSCSDDPVLHYRSEVYEESYRRRISGR
ncbi:catalase [Sporosarcina sp. BI001-red]|uniref:catalase n=1 Tax=Sporosarcina sp. BI001-red TaxID=2282866 RepID=UPI000E2565A5|nr:catalase [Sporosarcina sp. BI001-red]REB05628.1 catalase [Sporosarcina sp. BI001-red]